MSTAKASTAKSKKPAGMERGGANKIITTPMSGRGKKAKSQLGQMTPKNLTKKTFNK